jgi:hypothetical protein
VTLVWDDQRTDREAILAAMARSGFRQRAAQQRPPGF